MIAISTTWNYSEKCDLIRMFNEIKALGVNRIELGYNFTPARFSEATSVALDLGIEFVSLHNFCPLPSCNPFRRFFTNYYFLSSLDSEERKNALFYTKETINAAAKLGAKVVIVHAGAIEIDNKYTKQLIDLFKQGKILTKEANALRQELLMMRQIKKGPYIDALMDSLVELVQYANDAGIKLGLENRYYPNEIPNLDEAALLLKEFNGKGLVYWHDTGHSEAQERLGIIPKDSLLNNLDQYLCGFHLHDLNGISDHKAPLGGDFDFERISSYLMRQDLLKVIEAHQPANSQEIEKALKYFYTKNWL